MGPRGRVDISHPAGATEMGERANPWGAYWLGLVGVPRVLGITAPEVGVKLVLGGFLFEGAAGAAADIRPASPAARGAAPG